MDKPSTSKYTDVPECEVEDDEDFDESSDYESVDESGFSGMVIGADSNSSSSDENDGGAEDSMEVENASSDNTKDNKREVYLPGHPVNPDEELVFDPSAYVMLHEANAGLPCLSFDIIKDDLGIERSDFPHTAYIVTGTQADRKNRNKISVIKMSNLVKTMKEKGSDDEDDSDSSSDDDDTQEPNRKEPVMHSSSINHFGCVNRIRSCTYGDTVLAAAWSETSRVTIWDLKKHIRAVEHPSNVRIISATKKPKKPKKPLSNTEVEKPLHTFSGHTSEGFAIDWCNTTPGVLATGDCNSNIHIWKPQEGAWTVDIRPLKGHTGSVEDLQWSPNECNVLASCSSDKSIKIWDIRAAASKGSMLSLDGIHTSDINVISWNKSEPFIISGGDDGYLHVWDLRQFKSDAAIATFKYHTGAITTVEWHPTDSSVFASGGEDDQISLWDLAVERDVENDDNEVKEIPPQLLFTHLGQKSIKELHWHPQIPGTVISTAENGFNLFKTISV